MNTTELATLPASIRQRLELAQQLEAQHRPTEAASVIKQACAELARTAPSMCAALLAAQLGHRGLLRRVTQQRVTRVPVNETLFGITIGVRYETQTETNSYYEDIRFW